MQRISNEAFQSKKDNLFAITFLLYSLLKPQSSHMTLYHRDLVLALESVRCETASAVDAGCASPLSVVLHKSSRVY